MNLQQRDRHAAECTRRHGKLTHRQQLHVHVHPRPTRAPQRRHARQLAPPQRHLLLTHNSC